MEPKLGAAARKAAKRAGMSISAWLAEATADRIRNEALGQALDAWEAEEGPFTEAELAAAADSLPRARAKKSGRSYALTCPTGTRSG